MGSEKLADRLGFQQIKHERALIREHFQELAVKGGAKPVVHYIDGEAALLAFEDASRQVTLANLPV